MRSRRLPAHTLRRATSFCRADRGMKPACAAVPAGRCRTRLLCANRARARALAVHISKGAAKHRPQDRRSSAPALTSSLKTGDAARALDVKCHAACIDGCVCGCSVQRAGYACARRRGPTCKSRCKRACMGVHESADSESAE